ncbi:MAG: hypothetical protein L3J69_11110 [Desulfobacula sp.]|nr:hypothetical protein [Desulfobacula sp.]
MGLGVFFSTIGTFVGVRLLTSIMQPEEYGRLALGVSIAMGLVYSIGVALWGTITRFYAVARGDGGAQWYWRAIRKSLIYSSVVFSIIGPAIFLGLKYFGFSNMQASFWLLSILFGGIQIVGETGSALQNGARNRKIFSLHQNLLGWGRFLFAYLIVSFWISGAEGAMLGFVIAAIITMISQRYWVKKKILMKWPDTKCSKDRSIGFFNYFKPLAYSGVFIWIQLFADRWALNSFVSLVDVGIYFALYQISFAPALYCSSFLHHLLGPILYESAGDGSNREHMQQTINLNEKITVFIFVLILIGVGVAFWVGNSICTLLIAPDYQKGFWAFPWLLASGGLYSVGQQLLMSVYSGLDTKVIIPFRIIVTILAIGCYAIGGMVFGFSGIIWGGVIFSLLYLFLSFIMHRRVNIRKNRVA